MSNMLKIMLSIWGMSDMDWLGYINEENYSFHHIVKRSNGGSDNISNGAVLHLNSHAYLHTIEHYDIDKYIYLNTILKEINEQRSMPNIDQLKKIRDVLKEFEKEYEGKQSSRGKDIIKKEYRLDAEREFGKNKR